MQHFNTLNDLIYFAYTHSGITASADAEKIISTNKYLDREYKIVVRAKEKLKKLQVGPSESVLKNLMNYSKALSVKPSKSTGSIQLILN